jgi:hypothetical protein
MVFNCPISDSAANLQKIFTSSPIDWQIDDIIGGEKTLDFPKPFLPGVWVDAAAER